MILLKFSINTVFLNRDFIKVGQHEFAFCNEYPDSAYLCVQINRNTSALTDNSTGDRPIFSYGKEGAAKDLMP